MVRATLIIALLCVVCACSGISVKVTEQNSAPIARNSTYGWEVAALQSNQGIDERALLMDAQLRVEIARALASKDLRMVDEQASPQWIIAYRISSNTQYDQGGIISPRNDSERMLRQGMDDPNTETAFYNHPVPNQLESAELLITLISASDKQVFWEVSVSKLLEVDVLSEKALQQTIIRMVKKAFKPFPIVK